MLSVCGMMVFLAINVGVVLFWRHLTGSLVLAFGIHFGAYYWLIRKIVTWVVFPGSCWLFKRNLELNYMTNMGLHVISHIREFRSCLDIHRSATFNSPEVNDERTRLLAMTSGSIRMLITQLSQQIQAQRAQYKRN